MYPYINVEKTGMKLKIMLKLSGYTVKDIQDFLHLSCPQSVYQWLRGDRLPSVEHLLALSRLLGIHMEEMLVFQKQSMLTGMRKIVHDRELKRLLSYCECMELS